MPARKRKTEEPTLDNGYDQIRLAFNRALSTAFCGKKLLVTFCVLALCGLLAVFFRGLALHTGRWVTMSLTFLPIFLCAGVLLSMGLILIRAYHDEVKGSQVNYLEILNKSWELVIGASYIAIPLILAYLLLWMVLGVFYLLKEIPGLGDFIGLILAFGPFLLNLGSILLSMLNLLILFFVTPALALSSVGRLAVPQLVVNRLKADPFSGLIHLFLGLFPGLVALRTPWLTKHLACPTLRHVLLPLNAFDRLPTPRRAQ